MKEYFDVGEYHKTVTTSSPKAQSWVNRGLMNLWGFNHYAAIKCFKSAIEADPNCCFAFWGVSYAYGPHYNLLSVSNEEFDEGFKYLQLAL